VLGRGVSKITLYNQFLQLRAGEDINHEGAVFHLDFNKIFDEDGDFEVTHWERKNLGMTFVMMMTKKNKEDVILDPETNDEVV